MKKLILLILVLITFSLIAKPQKLESLTNFFQSTGSEINALYDYKLEGQYIILVSPKILDEFDLDYELGFIFGVLDIYYALNNSKDINNSFDFIVFKYINQDNQSIEITWNKQQIIEIVNMSSNNRSQYLQQNY